MNRKPRKLENIYMMNVILYFQQYSEVMRFITINHKCLEVVKSLKVNPFFVNVMSILKYVKHFTPETINGLCFVYDNPMLFQIVRNIKNVRFPAEMNDTMMKFLNKFVFVYLSPLNSNTQFFINNSIQLTSLQKITGDLDDIVKFFVIYTNNGALKNISFPKTIIIESYKGKNVDWSYEELEKTKQLTELLPDYNDIKIYITTQCDMYSKNIIKYLLEHKMLHKIQWYYRFPSYNVVDSERCNLLYSKTIPITAKQLNNTTGIIEQTLCNHLYIKFSDETNFKYSIPYFVKYLTVIDLFGLKESFNNLFANTENILSLTLKNCSILKFHTLTNLKEMKIMNSRNMKFDVDSLNRLETLEIQQSTYIKFNCKLPLLNNLILRYCSNCQFEGELNNVVYFTLCHCNTIEFPSLSFENKEVFIDASKDIHFYRDVQEKQKMNRISPIKFMSIGLKRCDKLFENTLSLPTLLNYKKNKYEYKNIVAMKQFLLYYNTSASLPIQINGDSIKLTGLITGEIKGFISLQFYNSYEMKDLIVIQNKTNEKDYECFKTKMINDANYFEICVEGNCDVSIGVIIDGKEKTLTNHVGVDNEFSVGYVVLFNRVYCGKKRYEFDTPKSYRPNENNYYGCGYIGCTKELFFTCNNEVVWKEKYEVYGISAAIGVRDFDKIYINRGTKPFVFDIVKLYQSLKD